MVFTFPEGRMQGIVVPGGRGLRLGKADLFIELKKITKIGIDVILVDIKAAPKPEKGKKKWEDAPPPPPQQGYYRGDRRDYGEYE